MNTYAAELDADNVVIRVIVGDADWATEHLGGTWVPSPKCGPGWLYLNGEIIPPSPYPSWTWDGEWQPPVPMPDGDWVWDENTQTWQPTPDLEDMT